VPERSRRTSFACDGVITWKGNAPRYHEPMKRRLLQLTGVGRWVESNVDGLVPERSRRTSFACDGVITWKGNAPRYHEPMKRRLLQLTGVGRCVESNGDGFRCLKEEDARPFSVMDSSHAKVDIFIVETMKPTPPPTHGSL
jgi:hypothetical protein